MVYLYDKPVELSDLSLQEAEVEEVRWMEYDKVLAEVRQEAEQGKAERYCIFLEELERIGEMYRQGMLRR